jgi:hypothetical protein
MHSIGKLGAGQERYYTEKVAEGAEDYYSGEGEAEGYWAGSAAAELGLAGKVDPEALTGMLTGHNPASGEPLGLRQRRRSRPGPRLRPDLLGAEVGLAHLGARRRGSRGRGRRRPSRLRRRRARLHGADGLLDSPRPRRAPVRPRQRLPRRRLRPPLLTGRDPQLHTHVLVANATRGPDGRWTRLYHPAIYDQAKTAGYIYEATLRHELTRRLGVRWQEVENGIAEIEGFDPEHLRTFSTRRAEILAATAPDASARARQIATLATRRAKDRDIAEESLRERWRSQAKEIGLSRDSIRATFGRVREVTAPTVEPAAVAEALTSHASHFDRRDVIQAVADQLRAGAPAARVEELAEAFLALDQVVAIGETAKGPRFTTERI